MQTKIGHVVFEHHDEFRGEIEIRKGDASITVPMEALRTLIAESVRYELVARVQKMKPADLLRRIV